MKEVVSEVQQYRVTMDVPRVARQGVTTRTLAVLGSYSAVGDLADYLIGSMELAGIDPDLARAWVVHHLHCVPEEVTTTKGKPETMPTGP